MVMYHTYEQYDVIQNDRQDHAMARGTLRVKNTLFGLCCVVVVCFRSILPLLRLTTSLSKGDYVAAAVPTKQSEKYML